MSAIRRGAKKSRAVAVSANTTKKTAIPWPDDVPLDPVRCTEALWLAKGNVKQAARILGTDTARLGYLISKDETLQTERAKAADLVLDRAEGNVIKALDDDTHGLEVAKWVLTNGGRSRGWGQQASTPLGLTFGASLPGSGAIAIRWQVEDPTKT